VRTETRGSDVDAVKTPKEYYYHYY
jgi:hypothetical protein